MRAVAALAKRGSSIPASRIWGALLLAVFAALLPGRAAAYEDGTITGYAGNNAFTCANGGCHSTAGGAIEGSYSYTPAFTIAAYIQASSTGNSITFALNRNSGASAVSGGLDIAISGGTLVAGADTQINTGEITHNSSVYGMDGLGNIDHSKPFSGGNVSWAFSYNAPAGTGTVTFYGCGNATNHDLTSDGDNPFCATQTVSIVNKPTGAADSYSTNENTTLSKNAASGVLANDTQPNGSATATLIGSPSHSSSFTLNSDGSFSYTPTNTYFGADSFSYQACYGTVCSSTTTVTLTVNQVAPTGVADSYSTNENTVLSKNAASGVLANDTDPSGTPTATLIGNPSHSSSFTLNSDGSFTYTPTTHYFGADSFTYQACHGAACSATTTVSLTVNQVAPTGVADSYSATENTLLSVGAGSGVLANDTDPSGTPTATLIGSPSHSASFTLNSDGSFTYTPTTHYFGADSFTYQACHGAACSATTTVSLTVNQVAPTGVTDSYSTNENTLLSKNAATGVLANDTDPSGTPTATLIGSPSHSSSFILNSDGSFTYTPTTHYFGSDSFTYQACHGGLCSSTTTVSLTVNQVAPTANADSYSTNENTALSPNAGSGVLANDTDPSGTPTASLVTNVTHGALTLNSDGSFTYTPTTHYFGADSFVYKACHGGLCSSNATVSLTVNQVAPTATADSYNVTQNTTLMVNAGSGVLANDSDPSGLSLTATLVGNVSHGTLTLNSDGSFSYTPTNSYHGGDSFTYYASNGTLNSSTATVSLSIGESPPTAVADAYSVNENATLTVNAGSGVLANDTDPSGLTLSAVLVTNVAHGSLTLNSDGSLSYTPTTHYYGTDSFTYHAHDTDALNSNTVTVTLTVNQLAPTATADSYSVNENATLTVNAGSGVLANDSDPSAASTATLVGNPAHSSSFTLNADGSFSYTPTTHYFGTDSFTYKDCSASLCSSVVTVSLTINQLAPTAVADSYTVNENATLTVNAGSGVLINDSDPSNLSLTAVLVSNVAHGSLTLNSNGSFTYTPNSTFSGFDSFTYHASNGTLSSTAATVTLTIVQQPPTAVADSYSTPTNTTLTVNAGSGVLANDSDPSHLSLHAMLVGNVSHGTLTLHSDGSFRYAPATNYSGSDSFTYKDTEVGGVLNSNTVTVTITVNLQPPTAGADRYSMNENSTLATNAANGVLANDHDPNGLPLTAALVGNVSHGSLVLNADGSFTYTPTANYFGGDSFTYTASDGSLSSSTTAVTFTVTQLAPTANADRYGTTENQVLVVSAPGVLANDTDPSRLPLSAVLASNVTHGTLALNSDGSFSYTPAKNYYGGDSFTYKASDGNLRSAAVTVNLTVTNAPTVKAPPNISMTSTGYLTQVTLGTATASDPVDGKLPVTATLASGDYRPGHYVVTYSATNAANVTATATQTVDIIPLVEFGPDPISGQNRTVNMTVLLNGSAATYPVTVNYTAGGTAGASASNATSGSVTISSGTEATIPIAINSVSGSSAAPPTVTLTMTSASNAVLDTHKTGTITIATADVPPTASLTATQASQPRTLIFSADGSVTLTANVVDVNAGDSLSYDWSGSDPKLNLVKTTTTPMQSFDPSTLAGPGNAAAHYLVQFKVTDARGNANTTTLDIGIQSGSASAPDGQPLSPTIDSNGNGIPDATDGLGDSNNNGIPDYMDPVTDTFVLPDETGTATTARIIEGDPGLQLALGTLALDQAAFAAPPAYPLYLASPILKSGPLPADKGMSNDGGVFDIDISGLAPGASFDIVLPLRTTVQSGAVFRLYSSTSGWYSFVSGSGATATMHAAADTASAATTANDALATANSINGQCPAPNSSAYKKGLQPFTDCVRLTITDGGANDVDGSSNGAVTLLGGVAAATPASSSSTSGTGGAVDPSVLALLAALAAGRRRRRPSVNQPWNSCQ